MKCFGMGNISIVRKLSPESLSFTFIVRHTKVRFIIMGKKLKVIDKPSYEFCLSANWTHFQQFFVSDMVKLGAKSQSEDTGCPVFTYSHVSLVFSFVVHLIRYLICG